MTTTSEYIQAMVVKNDSLRNAFARNKTRCFLLKRGTQRQIFVELLELKAGYVVKHGQRRNAIYLSHITENNMSDIWTESSFIAYGIPDSDNEMVVYEIQPRKEKVLPDVRSHEWKVLAIKVENERYSLKGSGQVASPNWLTFNGNHLTFNGNKLTFTV
jgi:hypothetical protein